MSALKKIMPINSLDYLINELGGPNKVAEMTGRKVHMVKQNGNETKENDDQETFSVENRTANAKKQINIKEKDEFISGKKRIAIISEAASCGVSLQAHKDYENKLKRLHIILELPWSADKAIQQIGRTHRSNQVSAPDYILLISKIAGEKRFASSVAKRIESMNALTKGDRNEAKSFDLKEFNIESKVNIFKNYLISCFI